MIIKRYIYYKWRKNRGRWKEVREESPEGGEQLQITRKRNKRVQEKEASDLAQEATKNIK